MTLPFRIPEIPEALKRSLPPGLRLVKRGDAELLVVEELLCPKGCSLITPTVKIHGVNAISLRIRAGEVSGLLFLDAFWGGHKKLFDFMFEGEVRDPVVEGLCPHCGLPMNVEGACTWEGCHSQWMVQFHLPDGASRILACARWGCPGHQLVAEELDKEVLEHVSGINFVSLRQACTVRFFSDVSAGAGC
jgi:hypothetical protein